MDEQVGKCKLRHAACTHAVHKQVVLSLRRCLTLSPSTPGEEGAFTFACSQCKALLTFSSCSSHAELHFSVSCLCRVTRYETPLPCSVFTDATHKDDHTFGVKMYEPPTIYSFTFAAIVDTAYDNNTLQVSMLSHLQGVSMGRDAMCEEGGC